MSKTPAEKIEEVMEVLDKLYEEAYINEWEYSFMESVSDSIGPPSLSPKQQEVLNEIYETACKSPF
jgi:hypothetical protein